MKFHVVRRVSHAQSPFRVVEQATGHEVGWINRFLDREYVRRLADNTLRMYAHELLHFIRWWESVHHDPPAPPSTTASPSPIAPCAMSSPTLLVRSLRAFIKPICGASRWDSGDRAWR